MRTWWLVTAVVLFVGNVAEAQSIRGQIFVPNPSYNERIEVRLEKAGGELLATSFSDSTGVFLFYDTPSGIDGLFVVVKLDGYEPVKEAIQFGRSGSTNIKINLVAKPNVVEVDAGQLDVVNLDDLGQRYSRRIVDEYERAQAEARQGNSAKAAERLEALLKQVPQFYQAHNTLGTAYQNLGRLQDAEKEYTTARDQNPRFALPLVNLGNLYIQLDELERARGHLQQAITINERSAMAHYLLGSVFYRVASYANAEQSLKRALELEPRMPQARLTFINVYTRQQKWQAALEQIDAFLAENPKAPERNQIHNIRTKVAQNLPAPK